ncbi:MAG: FIVAR domain-containing protein, partial [Lachnospiraceae bacterium]|nr:FIVAR domain-containing protein [Lachnospiraceae bacterium]
EALKAAEAVLANDNLTKDDQAVVDKVTAVLRAAYAGLTLEAPSVNKDALKKLIDKSVQYVEKEALYTPESYQIFKAAYDAALEIYSDEAATQDAVDAARATLEAARRTLREIPNKDKLEELLGKIKEVDLSLYTAKTAKAVKAAYAQAVAVFEDENATQAQIDQAVKALEEVAKELKIEDNTAVSGGQKSEDDNKVASDNSGKTTTTNSNNKTVKTGDEAPVMILVIMAALGLAVVVFTKRKRYDV